MDSMSELTETQVLKYLEDHPTFFKNYLQRGKNTANLTQSRLSTFSYKPRTRVSVVKRDLSPASSTTDLSNILKPINDDAGSNVGQKLENLLGDTNGESTDEISVAQRASTLQHMDEKELFVELIKDISNELDINRLSHKILVNVCLLTNSDRASLFFVHGKKEQKILVSELFDVTKSSTLQESMLASGEEIQVPFGVGIVGYTAQTGEVVNIRDAYKDSRFNAEVDRKMGYHTQTLLAMPIKNYEGEVVGVAQLINKASGEHIFTEEDEKVFSTYLTFCGIGLTNAQLFELSVKEYKRNKVLLQLARGIFEEQTSMDILMNKILSQAQQLLSCESCTVFLVSDDVEVAEQFDRIFHLSDEENETSEGSWSTKTGIPGIVAMTGEVVNLSDAQSDSRFNKEADDKRGSITKTILCMPIKDQDGKIVGAFQLVNKLDCTPFDDNDESLFEAFTIFCGLGIHNTKLFERASKLLAKQRVAMEMLSFHASAHPDDTERIKDVEVPPENQYQLTSFVFDDVSLAEDETVLASLRMFLDLRLMETFRIKHKTLCQWVLTVKKNYRPVTYHNWRHAFNVAQTMFAMMTEGMMRKHFNDLEVLSLLMACFCHDLDHRGTNNTFQLKTESPLATLYTTSTLEHHHFDQCLMILNNENNNILSELSEEEYRTVIELIEHAILATDLALYFQKRGDFEKLVKAGNAEWNIEEQRTLLRGMMMTGCDVAAITKPWNIQRRVVSLVASEFFEQGDLEREKLNQEPIPMMDRRKRDELPNMQIGFINAICLPLYELISEVETGLKPLHDGCLTNKSNWEKEAAISECKDEENNPEEIVEAKRTSVGESKRNHRNSIGHVSDGGSSKRTSSSSMENGKKKTTKQVSFDETVLLASNKVVGNEIEKGNKSKTCAVL